MSEKEHVNIYEYKPSEERQAAETYIALIEDGKTNDELIEYIYTLNPYNVDDKAMLEAFGKTATNLDVRKEAMRRLYYTK